MIPVDDRELRPAARGALTQPQVPERLAGGHLGGEGPNQVSETALGRLLRAGEEEVAQPRILVVGTSRFIQ